MIVTVTPNPAFDRTVHIRGFAVGAINRAVGERTDIGGKGINVALHLARLGCDVVAAGFLGRRDIHAVVETLAGYGIQSEFVCVAGDTRVNLKILDPVTRQETEINESGPSVTHEAVEELLDRVRGLASRSGAIVFSGSLPPGVPDEFYARAIGLSAAAGVKTVLDATGAALRHGIAARPDLVKLNRAEAEELLSVSLRDDGELVEAAKRLVDHGAQTAVISVGPAGAVCATSAGAWLARAPRITPRNTVGAGDAMVAALAWALMRGDPPLEALRLATALGSAAAASEAPLPCDGRLEALLPQVLVEMAAADETCDDARTVS